MPVSKNRKDHKKKSNKRLEEKKIAERKFKQRLLEQYLETQRQMAEKTQKFGEVVENSDIDVDIDMTDTDFMIEDVPFEEVPKVEENK